MSSARSSDNFWPNSSKYIAANNKKKEKEETISELLATIDESPEFYDPFSDLNLFLAKKIKQEMQQCGSSKKWTHKIQEELIFKIAPEFHEKFPQYRLGVSALKRTWEKIAHFSEQIHKQREALTQDGKLNIHFFIRENLKNYTVLKPPINLHPSYFAHQLAMKMSECIATIDGMRPNLDHLTKLVWSVQRHLLAGGVEYLKSPYDEYDKIDALIVKTILEITAKDPQIGYHDLEHKVKEGLHSLQSYSSVDSMQNNIAALLAEKLYAQLPLHTLVLAEQKEALSSFIRRHLALGKMIEPQLSNLVRRIIALYTLVCNFPKDLTEERLKSAVLAIYPAPRANRPDLPQALYAFIAAELVLMKSEEYCRSPSYVADAVWNAYQEAALLPVLHGTEILEIAIWKHLSETEGFLEKLTFRIGQKIEEEIAGILIENPHRSFAALVQDTIQFFKRTKELVRNKPWSEIEKKVQIWAIQGDMLCRWIRIDPESTLLRMICQKWKESPGSLPHHTFVSEICQTYLKSYPELASYSSQLNLRVWILYKYAWYSQFAHEEESSFDRFLKWHSSSLLSAGATSDHHHLVQKLEETVSKMLPLIPFERTQADAVLT